jgi:hypothetical protein
MAINQHPNNIVGIKRITKKSNFNSKKQSVIGPKDQKSFEAPLPVLRDWRGLMAFPKEYILSNTNSGEHSVFDKQGSKVVSMLQMHAKSSSFIKAEKKLPETAVS